MHWSYQSGTKPNLVAKILATKFGFVPDWLCLSWTNPSMLLLLIDPLPKLDCNQCEMQNMRLYDEGLKSVSINSACNFQIGESVY